jgi:hypothetical protein
MRKRTFSLKAKLALLSAGSVLILGITFCLVVLVVLSRTFDRQAADAVNLSFKGIDRLLQQDVARTLGAVQIAAASSDLTQSAAGGPSAALTARLDAVVRLSGTDYACMIDPAGTVLAQAGSAPAAQSRATSAAVRQAIEGRAAAGFEVPELGRFEFRAAAPVMADGKLRGVLILGTVLDGRAELVDEVKRLYGVECTLFAGDTRATTTIVRDGKRFTGTKMDNPAVLSTVLAQGQPFFNRNLIGGLEYDTAYWPLRSADGAVAGMGFIGRDRDHVRAAYLHLFVTIAGTIAAVGLLILGASLWMARSIGANVHGLVESLLSGSDEVTGAAAQVSTASQHLAAASSRQASELEEASASLEEISSMVRSNTDNAEQSTGFARQARAAAERGVQDMEAMGQAMQAIKASSDDIAKIIKTIDEIAFQTNILALNAAVEAARAGEAGAGFAVVAEEVRSLAQRSAAAAKETETQISAAIARTAQGVEGSAKVGASLGQIVELVRKVDDLSAEVCTASREQSQGLELLTKSVGSMDSLTQENAASSEETASAATELSSQAHALRDTARNLLLFVDGGAIASQHAECGATSDESDSAVDGATLPPAAAPARSAE